MDISIIIVSYNTAEILRTCLLSIEKSLKYLASKKIHIEVIVIDNASTDGSVPLIEKNFPFVHLIKNTTNQGFAKANNQGIRHAKGKNVLLLNSDTEIQRTTLEILQQQKEKLSAHVLGCKLLNTDGSLQQSLGYFPNFFRVLSWMFFFDDIPVLASIIQPYHIQNARFYDSPHQVDWVTGACMFIEKECIDTVGYLDENIFMYGEEVEWCYRIKNAGFTIAYTPETSIFHHKGKSGSGNLSGIVEEFRSIRYFYQKHTSVFQVFLVRIILKFGALLRLILFGIIMGHSKKASLYAKAFSMA